MSYVLTDEDYFLKWGKTKIVINHTQQRKILFSPYRLSILSNFLTANFKRTMPNVKCVFFAHIIVRKTIVVTTTLRFVWIESEREGAE